jgi:DNA repair exonuclease SbcCD ATPase subunit
MRILNLRASNFMRLTAVEITPDGAMIDIVGKNGAGKTSVLNAIYAALAGAGALPSKPIRKGEKDARIQITLGDGQKVALVVRRTFANKEDGSYTTSVVVENADGARYGSPQKILDGLLGALSFDPLAFTRMDAKAQLRELRDLVPGVDFDAIDAANKEDYELRQDVNRRAKATRAQLEALTIPGDPRQERVDESALVAELEAAGEKRAEIDREATRRTDMLRTAREHREEAGRERQIAEAFRKDIADFEEKIADLKEKIVRFEQRATTHETAADQIVSDAEALPPLGHPPATNEIRARIDAARKANLAVTERERAIARREELAGEVERLEAQARMFTKNMDQREADKARAVAEANLPVEGLAFTSDEVLLNGLPFDQASDAEKLRASVAIAAAKNPKLRVIRIRDGSLLDSSGVAALAAFAAEHDLQIWREVVADDAKTGIVIEDGRLASAKDVAA